MQSSSSSSSRVVRVTRGDPGASQQLVQEFESGDMTPVFRSRTQVSSRDTEDVSRSADSHGGIRTVHTTRVVKRVTTSARGENKTFTETTVTSSGGGGEEPVVEIVRASPDVRTVTKTTTKVIKQSAAGSKSERPTTTTTVRRTITEPKVTEKSRKVVRKAATTTTDGSSKKSKISEIITGLGEAVTARDALLKWAQRTTERYPGVRVTDFTNSWKDGLAFNAIIHRNRPDLLDFRSLRTQKVRDNLENAFSLAEKEFGITRLLDPEDVDTPEPDEKSIITYISSVYDVFPDPPSHHPFADDEKHRKLDEYTVLSRTLLIWIKESIEMLKKRKFSNSLIDLKALLVECSRFRTEDVPKRMRDKQRLSHLHREIQKLSHESGLAEISSELRFDNIEKLWNSMVTAQQERDQAIRDEISRIEKLQRLAEKVNREIKQCDGKIDDVERRIKEEEKRIQRLHLTDAKYNCDQIDNDLKQVNDSLKSLSKDISNLVDKNYHHAADMQRRIRTLYESYEHLVFVFQNNLMANLSTKAIKIEEKKSVKSKVLESDQKSFETSKTFLQLKEHMDWVEKKMKRINELEFGRDLSNMRSCLEQLKTEQKAVENYKRKIDQCSSQKNNYKGSDYISYCEMLNTLEKSFSDLQSTSSKKVLDCETLIDFVQSATKELKWISEKEDVEVSRDWSAKNLNLIELEHHQEILTSELEKREIQYNSIQSIGESRLLQNHPAVKQIENFLTTMQTKWSWLLQLTLCLDIHLKHAQTYHQFFKEARECDHWLKRTEEKLNTSFSRNVFSIDEGEQYLKEMHRLRDDLSRYNDIVLSVIQRSLDIVPLKQRRQPVSRPLKILCICDYKQSNLSLSKGSTLWLHDNIQRTRWKVRTESGVEEMVPAVCFLIPSPNPEAIEFSENLRSRYDTVLNLWNTKERKLRQNLVFATMKVVKSWDVTQFSSMEANQRESILHALNEDAEKLLREDATDNATIMKLKQEMEQCNQLFQSLVEKSSDESNQKSPKGLGKKLLDEISTLQNTLIEKEKTLKAKVNVPFAWNIDTLENLVVDHKEYEVNLRSFEDQVFRIKQSYQSLNRKTTALQTRYDSLIATWERIWEQSNLYVEKLKALEIALHGLEDATQVISNFEVKLSSYDPMPSDMNSLHNVHESLLSFQNEVQQNQSVIDSLSEYSRNLRNLMQRGKQKHSVLSDVNKYENDVKKLTKRFDDVRSQIVERLRSCGGASDLLRTYKTKYEKDNVWVSETTVKVNSMRTIKTMTTKEVEMHVEPTMNLYSSIAEKKSSIDQTNVLGARYIREAKIYDLRLKHYKENLEEEHPSLDASLRKKAKFIVGAETVGKELDDLNQQYRQLVQRILKYLEELKKRFSKQNEQKLCNFISKAVPVTLKTFHTIIEQAPAPDVMEFNSTPITPTLAYSIDSSMDTEYNVAKGTSVKFLDLSGDGNTFHVESHKTGDVEMQVADMDNFSSNSVQKGWIDETRSFSDKVFAFDEVEASANICQVKGIFNPKTGSMVTLCDAVRQGTLNLYTEEFIDLRTGRRMSLQSAVLKGYIDRNLLERITVKCGIYFPGVKEELSLLEAMQKNLYDIKRGVFLNPQDGSIITLTDAFHLGIIKKAGIKSLIDMKFIKSHNLTLAEAVQGEFLDSKTGVFRDPITNLSIPFSEAVDKGFLNIKLSKNLDGGISLSEAIDRKIVHEQSGQIMDEDSGEKLTIDEAVARGLLCSNVKEILDTLTNEIFSLEDALLLGIINAQSGKYVNRKTGSNMSLVEAHRNNFIFKPLTLRDAFEKKLLDECGNIIDPFTSEKLSIIAALAKGLLDSEAKCVVDPISHDLLTLPDALKKEVITADGKLWDSQNKNSINFSKAIELGYITSVCNKMVFDIDGFKDMSSGELISFNEAVERKIIDTSLKKYKDSVKGRVLSFDEAVSEQYIMPQVYDMLSKPIGIKDGNGIELSVIDCVNSDIIDRKTGVLKDPKTKKTIYLKEAITKNIITPEGAALLKGLLNIIVTTATVTRTTTKYVNVDDMSEVPVSVISSLETETKKFVNQNKLELKHKKYPETASYDSDNKKTINSEKMSSLSIRTNNVVTENSIKSLADIYEQKNDSTLPQNVSKTDHSISGKNTALSTDIFLDTDKKTLIQNGDNFHVDKRQKINQQFLLSSSVKRLYNQDNEGAEEKTMLSIEDLEFSPYTIGTESEANFRCKQSFDNALADSSQIHVKTLELPADGWYLNEAISENLFDVDTGLFTVPGTDRLVSFEETINMEIINPLSASVIEPETKCSVSLNRALNKGILDSTGHYHDSASKSVISMREAIDNQFIILIDRHDAQTPSDSHLFYGTRTGSYALHSDVLSTNVKDIEKYSSKLKDDDVEGFHTVLSKKSYNADHSNTMPFTVSNLSNKDKEIKTHTNVQVEKFINSLSRESADANIDKISSEDQISDLNNIEQKINVFKGKNIIKSKFEVTLGTDRTLDTSEKAVTVLQKVRKKVAPPRDCVKEGLIDKKTADILVSYKTDDQKSLTLAEAISNNLIDADKGKITDIRNNEKLSIKKALERNIVDDDSGFLLIPVGRPLTLPEAYDAGLIEEVSHKIIHPETGKLLNVKEAIMCDIINPFSLLVLPKSKRSLTVEEALSSGALNPSGKICFPGGEMGMVEAIQKKVMFQPPKDVTKSIPPLAPTFPVALEYGYIDFKDKKYVHPITKTKIPLKKAIQNNKIMVIPTQVTKESISLDEAIDKNLINPATKTFTHPLTKVELSVAEAVEDGLLMIKPDKSSLLQSLITVSRTTTETNFSASYSIPAIKLKPGYKVNEFGNVVTDYSDREISVADAIDKGIIYVSKTVEEQEKTLTFNEAVKQGLIDAEKGLYIDPHSQLNIPVSSALKMQLITPFESENFETQFTEKCKCIDNESYIYDTESKSFISMQDAVKKNMINIDSGEFLHKKSGLKYNIKDAAKFGLLAIVSAPVLAVIAAKKSLHTEKKNDENTTLPIKSASEFSISSTKTSDKIDGKIRKCEKLSEVPSKGVSKFLNQDKPLSCEMNTTNTSHNQLVPKSVTEVEFIPFAKNIDKSPIEEMKPSTKQEFESFVKNISDISNEKSSVQFVSKTELKTSTEIEFKLLDEEADQDKRKQSSVENILKMPAKQIPESSSKEICKSAVQSTFNLTLKNLSESLTKESAKMSTRKTYGLTVEQLPESPTKKIIESPIEKVPEVPNKRPSELPTRKLPDSPVKKSPESPTRKSPQSSSRKSLESPIRQLPESPIRESSESFSKKLPQVSSKKKSVSSSGRSLESPTKSPESLTRSLESPPTRSPESLVRVPESLPIRSSESPVKVPESPTKRTHESPTKKAFESPTRRMPESPTKRAPESPTRKLLESPTEKLSESPVKKVFESLTKILPGFPTKKLPESSLQHLPESPLQQLPESPSRKLSESPTRKSPELSARKSPEHSANKFLESSTKIKHDSFVKESDKVSERKLFAEKTIEYPEKLPESLNITELAFEKIPDSSTKQSTESSVKKTRVPSAEKTPESPSKKASELPARKILESPTRKATELLTKMAPESPTRKSLVSPTRKSPESPTRKTPESPTRKSPESPTRKTPELPTKKTPESPTKKTPESPTKKTPELPTKKIPESSESFVKPESPTKKTLESSIKKIPESPTKKIPESPIKETPESPTKKTLESKKSTELPKASLDLSKKSLEFLDKEMHESFNRQSVKKESKLLSNVVCKSVTEFSLDSSVKKAPDISANEINNSSTEKVLGFDKKTDDQKESNVLSSIPKMKRESPERSSKKDAFEKHSPKSPHKSDSPNKTNAVQTSKELYSSQGSISKISSDLKLTDRSNSSVNMEISSSTKHDRETTIKTKLNLPLKQGDESLSKELLFNVEKNKTVFFESKSVAPTSKTKKSESEEVLSKGAFVKDTSTVNLSTAVKSKPFISKFSSEFTDLINEDSDSFEEAKRSDVSSDMQSFSSYGLISDVSSSDVFNIADKYSGSLSIMPVSTARTVAHSAITINETYTEVTKEISVTSPKNLLLCDAIQSGVVNPETTYILFGDQRVILQQALWNNLVSMETHIIMSGSNEIAVDEEHYKNSSLDNSGNESVMAIEENYKICGENTNKLISWIQDIEQRLAELGLVKEELSSLQHQINITKALKDELESQQHLVNVCLDQVRQLVQQGLEVLSKEELIQLQKNLQSVKKRYDTIINDCDRLLRKLVAAQEGLEKFKAEFTVFKEWLSHAEKELNEKEKLLGNLKKLQDNNEKFKLFTNDVIAHQADLRFITMAAQKFVDESKEYLKTLNEFRVNLPQRLPHFEPVDSQVKSDVQEITSKYHNLLNNSNRLSDNFSVICVKHSYYIESYNKAKTFLTEIKKSSKKLLEEPVAAEPSAIQEQLDHIKTLNVELVGQGRIIETVSQASKTLFDNLENIHVSSAECKNIEHSSNSLQNEYSELINSVSSKVKELQTALIHSQDIQDGLDRLLKWLSETENAFRNQSKPVSLILERLNSQIQEFKILQADFNSNKQSIDTLNSSAADLINSSNPKLAKKVENKLKEINTRFEKLRERITKREELLEDVSSSLRTFEAMSSQFEQWSITMIDRIENHDAVQHLEIDGFASFVEYAMKQKNSMQDDYEQIIKTAKSLIAKHDVTDSSYIKDKMKAVEQQWKTLGDIINEKQRIEKSRSEQFTSYDALRRKVLEWLSKTETSVKTLEPVSLDQTVLKKQLSEVKLLVKEHTDYAPTVEKLNNVGGTYDSMVKSDAPHKKMSSPVKKVPSPVRKSPSKDHKEMKSPDSVPSSPVKSQYVTQSPLSTGSSGFSSRRSSTDNFGGLEDLSPVQQQLSEINHRYSLISVKISDRTQEINTLTEALKSYADIIKTIATFLETKEKVLVKENVPLMKEQADKHLKTLKTIQDEMLEKQAEMDRLKVQTRDLLKRKSGVAGASELENKVSEIDKEWLRMSTCIKQRIGFIKEFQDFQNAQELLSSWLSQKEKMFQVLGPIAFEPRMVSSQVQQVQVMKDEFSTQKSFLSRLNESGLAIINHSDVPKSDAKKIKEQIEMIRHLWNDLFNRLEERDKNLEAANAVVKDFHKYQTELQEKLQKISETFDSIFESGISIDIQLKRLNELEDNFEKQRPLLTNADIICEKLCEILSDSASKNDIKSKITSLEKSYSQLNKKINNKKAELESCLKDDLVFYNSCDDIQTWLNKIEKQVLADVHVSAVTEVLQKQLKDFEPLYKQVMNKEYEIHLLQAKGVDVAKTSVKHDANTLKNKLDNIQKQWERLRKTTIDRHTHIQCCLDNSKKYGSMLENFALWLKNCEDRLMSIKPIRERERESVQRSTLNKQVKEIQSLKNDISKHIQEYENIRQLGETLINSCDTDNESIKKQLEGLKKRWNSLNQGISSRAQLFEDLTQKLLEYHEKSRDLQHAIQRIEDKLCVCVSSHDSLDSISRDLILLEQLKNLQKEATDLKKQLTEVKEFAKKVIEKSEPDSDVSDIVKDVEIIEKRYKTLMKTLEERCASLTVASEVISQFTEQIKSVHSELNTLDEVFEKMSPVSREESVLKKQIAEIKEFSLKLSKVRKNLEDTEHNHQNMIQKGYTSESKSYKEQLKNIQRQISRLEDHTKHRIISLESMLTKLEQFSQDYKDTMNELTAIIKEESTFESISGSVENIRNQQQIFKKFRSEKIYPLGKHIEECNKIGQGLIQSAPVGVKTNKLEQDLENLNEMWNNLQESLNDHEKKLDVALLQSGKFQEALVGVQKWLKDTEELVTNQKPPSPDYKVVKAQVQEQKFVKKMLLDRRNSVMSLKTMGTELLQTSKASKEQKQADGQMSQIIQRFEELTERAQKRMDSLEKATPVAQELQTIMLPLMEWMEQTEKKLAIMEIIPVEDERIKKRIAEHQEIHKDITERKKSLDTLKDVSVKLQRLIGKDESEVLQQRIQNVLKKYSEITEKSSKIGTTLKNAKKSVTVFTETYERTITWVEKTTVRLSSYQIFSIYSDKLLIQVKDLKKLKADISKEHDGINNIISSGQDIMKHASGGDAIQMKEKLDALNIKFSDLVNHVNERLKVAEESLPLVQSFYASHDKLSQWFERAEKSLKMLESVSLDVQENNIEKLQNEIQEYRSDLEVLNHVGPRISQLSPGDGATVIESIISKANHRFESISESVQRTAERIKLAVQRKFDVISDIDDLFEWFKDIEKQVDEAEGLSPELDSLTALLKQQKALNNEVNSQKTRVRDILASAKKLMRESSSEDLSHIREKIETLKTVSDQVSTVCQDRLSALEQALPLAEHFFETHTDLGLWLDEVEGEAELLEAPALNSIQIKKQQDRNKGLVQSVQEHKPLVDKLNKTGSALTKLCKEDEVEKVEVILESDNSRYNALRKILREHQSALEEALQATAQFSDKLEGMLSALTSTADQIHNAEPISAHPDKIHEQINDNKAVLQDIDKRTTALEAVKKAADDVITKASSIDEPAVRDIKQKLTRLNGLWDTIQTAARNRGKSLEEALVAAEKFWDELTAVMKALKELQDNLNTQEAPAVEPNAVQQQQEVLQEIKQEISQTKPEVDHCRQAGQDLMQLCGEPDKPEVKKHIEDLDSVWENVTTLYAKREQNLIDAMEKAMSFHDTLQNLLEFLDTAEEKFGSFGAVSGDINSVKQQVNQLKEFKLEVDPHMVEVESLNRQAQELMERTSPDQSLAIREPLADISKRWDDLLKGIVDRQREMENMLLKLGQFQHSLEELIIWMSKSEKALDELKPVFADPQVIEVILAKHKVVINDIQAHESGLNALNRAGRQLTESDLGATDAKSTQSKLNNLNVRWQQLQEKSAERQRELEETLKEAQQFHQEIQDLLMWLSDVDGQLQTSKPVGGLPETAKEQLNHFMDIFSELDNNRSKIENVLQQGQTYLKKSAENSTKTLQHSLNILKQRWDSVLNKANDRKIKLEIALREATEFNDALQKFVEWLTKAEKYLTSLKPVSRSMKIVLEQIEDHRNFQKDVGSHREVMLNLDKKGTHLKYFSQKQDVILIKNLLISVQHRWERVVSKAAERTRALDHGYKESKEFHDMWTSLSNWLDEAEKSLDSITHFGNDPVKIKQLLAKHKEFQRVLGSKQTQFDATMRMGRALKDKCPKQDVSILQGMMDELKSRWNKVCAKSVDRQRKLEEALLCSGQFKEAVQALMDWLDKALSKLADSKLYHGDLDTVTSLIEKHKTFQEELQNRGVSLESVRKTAIDLKAASSPEDSDRISAEIEQLNLKWKKISKLSEDYKNQLDSALRLAEKLHKSVHMLLEWLSDAEMKLRFIGPLPDDEEKTRKQISEHQNFLEEMATQEKNKDGILELAQQILQKCHPDGISVIRHWITIIQSRWEEISLWARQRDQRLKDHLQSLREIIDLLEELLAWLINAEITLTTLEAEPLPDVLSELEKLIKEHQTFMDDMSKKQPDVERVSKAFSSKRQASKALSHARTPTPIKDRTSRDKNSRGISSSPIHTSTPLKHTQAESDIKHPRAKLLLEKWRNVWLLAMERQRRLQDKYNYLLELERIKNFDFNDWRRRYLGWMNHKKSRIMDQFRKIDKDNDGKVTKQEFIDGILQSKFPTSRLEMERVADIFDRNGDGFIDTKEYIDTLRPDREGGPKTEAEKIQDEVQKQVAKCTCVNRFKVYQVGEGKYRFGESQKLRLVRILRSTVMVRVGGGWVALDEFLVKNDPCRAKGRTNLELREQFILAEGVSQSMAPFKSKPSPNSSVSSQSGTSLSQSGSPVSSAGPITKIREKSERSTPMRQSRVSADTSSDISGPSFSESDSISNRSHTTPTFSRLAKHTGSKSGSRPSSRQGSRPSSRAASDLSQDNVENYKSKKSPANNISSHQHTPNSSLSNKGGTVGSKIPSAKKVSTMGQAKSSSQENVKK